MNSKVFFLAGALYGLIGTALGAFAAHVLKTKLDERMFQIFEVAVRYQLYHALALLIIGLVGLHFNHRWLGISGWFLIIGVFIFSGSLYMLSLSQIKAWGAVTPIGGLLLLAGWMFLFLSFLRN